MTTWRMQVVSNTSPVLNLAIIGRLELLRDQFGQVAIPAGVWDELRADEPLPGSRAVASAMTEGWLRVVSVHNKSLATALRVDLDTGEAEAIALAVELDAELVLLDEREARQRAKDLGLTVTGALGVLLRAKLRKAIPSLEHEVNALRTLAGFRIHDQLVETLLHDAGERPRGLR